ncbi:hypothetical protein [Gimesia chilikensis]|uniref:Uncharacterized protein n=1 Tax=Gimesia chilikensis TaxID=2605989 RepID=A0A517PRB9_9PLAN|nr:hypothetical protein [Gimesia chilikensis]QDT21915.1 hypothetical protein HG66A1_37200 [Gimesia chilikensis]
MNDATVKPHSNIKDETSLHSEFVGMLFALAIAQVAVESADLVNHKFYSLKSDFLPAFSHLFLATTIIGSSWIGWKSSKSSMSKINNIFTLNSIELLIDVFLVVCYFIIVKSVETISPLGHFVPSAKPEVLWTTVILTTYFLWDLLTKLFKKIELAPHSVEGPTLQNKSQIVQKVCSCPIIILKKLWLWVTKWEWKSFLNRGWASFVCSFMSILAFYFLPLETTNTLTIVFIDLDLFFLILTFRAMKLEDFDKLSTCQHVGWITLLVFFLGLMISLHLLPK